MGAQPKESISIVSDYTINDPRFLRGQVLQPGASVTGLVTFVARLDIGASIRFGGGSMSYSDPTIEVNDE